MISLGSAKDIIHVIEQDGWMMEVLHTVRSLNLPDCWVCAGFVRSKVWDILHGFTDGTSLPDVDVVYHDEGDIREVTEKALEQRLRLASSSVPWSVKNQARMHTVNGVPPYTSTFDAIAHFPETATAVAVRLMDNGSVELIAPFGVDDLVNLLVRPTPSFQSGDKVQIYEQRIARKNWQLTWPKLTVVHPASR